MKKVTYKQIVYCYYYYGIIQQHGEMEFGGQQISADNPTKLVRERNLLRLFFSPH